MSSPGDVATDRSSAMALPMATSSPSTRQLTRGVSIRKPSFVRRARRVMHRYYEWKTEHQYLGRYSIDKLLALNKYQKETSPLRVFAVVALTPLPSLLVTLLLATIPLQNPLLGVDRNAGYFLQSWLAYASLIFCMSLYIRRALVIPRTIYSHRDAVVVGLLSAGANELLMVALSALWRFPIPFRDLVGSPTVVALVALVHVLMFRTRLRHYSQPAKKYLPLMCAQSSTFVIFRSVSLLFKTVPPGAQAVITVAFPVLRAAIKRWIWRFTGSLEDLSTDVTFCVVEIFGCIFQNFCLQKARTVEIGMLIIAVDFVQAILEAHFYIEHKFVVDGRQTVRTAVKIVEGALFPGTLRSHMTDKPLHRQNSNKSLVDTSTDSRSVPLSPVENMAKSGASRQASSFRRKSKILAAPVPEKLLELAAIDFDMTISGDISSPSTGMTAPKSARRTSIDDIDISHRQHAKTLSQTLQLLFSCEVLVFAEYAEVSCSVLYGVYTLVLYHMPCAKYNFSFIGLAKSDFWNSIVNTAVYAALEGFTMFFLFVLVRTKYGLSTLYQLAFVLEKYWMSVQGKMVGSLVLIFVLNTVHHATDLLEDPIKKASQNT